MRHKTAMASCYSHPQGSWIDSDAMPTAWDAHVWRNGSSACCDSGHDIGFDVGFFG
jgi:hypothetical protein